MFEDKKILHPKVPQSPIYTDITFVQKIHSIIQKSFQLIKKRLDCEEEKKGSLKKNTFLQHKSKFVNTLTEFFRPRDLRRI